jgi:acetyl-CoA C-acetyltransferase
VPGVTIDRQCGSSQQALHFAAQGVLSGTQDLVVAGGVQNMSAIPISAAMLAGQPYGFSTPFAESPGWQARYGDQEVSQFRSAQLIADKWGITREEMDELALQSHARAAAGTDDGFFSGEIVPVPIKDEQGNLTGEMLATDEGIRRGGTMEKLGSLPPAWVSDDQPAPDITAGNASQMTDGASAMLIAERSVAERLGLPIRARFAHFAVAAEDPVLVLSAPVPVTYKLMERSGMKPTDWDAVECNEAFASIALMWQKEFDYPMEQFNPRGGAIALGHPLGASGVALMTRLLRHLEATGGRFGFQTMCEGGGQANATVIERL